MEHAGVRPIGIHPKIPDRQRFERWPLKVRPERSGGRYLPTACSHTFIMLSTAASSIPVNGDG
jgi:hypothetical protein